MVTPQEPCSARLLRPDGSVAVDMPLSEIQTILEAPRLKTGKPETWAIEFPVMEEDASFRIGAPAVPIASPDQSCFLF